MKTTSAPPDALQDLYACASDPIFFIHHYVKIRHPKLGTIPFDLWGWQERLLERFLDHRLIILLKARQLGASELATAYALWTIRFFPSKTVLIISKNEKAAQELMDRAQFAHENLPPWLRAGEMSLDGCRLSKVNTSSLEVQHVMSDASVHPSSIESLPATKNTGRSASASLVILDEWAHQQFDSDIWTAIEPTIDAGGSLIGISTANGLGNQFHKTWTRAVAKQNTFMPIFLHWNRRTDRDAAWYDEKSRNMEPWQLHQEYPSDPAEAFIQSGRPVFDRAYLLPHAEHIQQVKPLSDSDGLTIWAEPEPGHTYLIGADVAEGTVNGDYDAAIVLDRQTWQQVTELHGHWPFEVYAAKLDALGRHYNNALLAIERNNHGHAVLLALTSGIAHSDEDGQPKSYPKLYYTSDALVTGAPMQTKPGWETTAKTKPLVIGALAKALREGTYHPMSQAFLDEAMIYAYQDNGSMSAPPGYHDDRVMSHAIAVHLASLPDMGEAALAYMSQMSAVVQQRAALMHPDPIGIPRFPQ